MLNDILLEDDIKRWIHEDCPAWDVSSLPIYKNVIEQAKIIAKQNGIACGSNILVKVFSELKVEVTSNISDGDHINEGDVLFTLEGPAPNILQAERVGLNIFSHMSGIATYTHALVSKINSEGLNTIIAATRKTLPGLRKYQKWAVTVGGGDTHRMNLSSMVMLKENHVAAYGGITEAIQQIRENTSFSMRMEIEVRNNEEAIEAAESRVDIIMLDNYKPEQIKEILPIIKGISSDSLIEASGNINEETYLDYARSGVDIISMGRITHSSKFFDCSLLFDTVR